MHGFANLVAVLEHSAAEPRQAALRAYFASAAAADAAWALHLLAGGSSGARLPQAVQRAAALQATGLPHWLLDECQKATGDWAETLSLIWPDPPAGSNTGPGTEPSPSLSTWMQERLPRLRGLPPEDQSQQLADWLGALDRPGRWVLARLLGGGLRAGLPLLQLQQALAAHAGLDARVLAQRMAASASRAMPSAARYLAWTAPAPASESSLGLPCPLTPRQALALPDPPADSLARQLGPAAQWLARWTYGGPRVRLVKRGGQAWLWSEQDELIGARFPELMAPAAALPDGTVLEGELLVWPDSAAAPAPPEHLRQRLQRKTLSADLLARAPAVLLLHDLPEHQGQDLRQQPLDERLHRLAAWLADAPADQRNGAPQARSAWLAWRMATAVAAPDWSGDGRLRRLQPPPGATGLLLRRRGNPASRGADTDVDAAEKEKATKTEKAAADASAELEVEWLWSIEPLQVQAVLIYAQPDAAAPGSHLSDYTLAVWSRPPRDEAEVRSVLDAIARREPPRPGALQLVVVARAQGRPGRSPGADPAHSDVRSADGSDNNACSGTSVNNDAGKDALTDPDTGLSVADRAELDGLIRASTVQKFGPVRSLLPGVVLTLGFERLHPSPRHKSGLVLQAPQVLGWKRAWPLHRAASLADLCALLPAEPVSVSQENAQVSAQEPGQPGALAPSAPGAGAAAPAPGGSASLFD